MICFIFLKKILSHNLEAMLIYRMIEIIAFPYQALILTIIALVIKNKLNKLFYLNDFFIILSCFCMFKILEDLQFMVFHFL